MRLLSALLAFVLTGVCLASQQGPFSTSQDELVYQGKSLGDWIALAKGQDLVLRRKALAALKHFLKDEDPLVRQAIASALGDTREAGVPALMDLLKDEDLEVRKAAVRALGSVGPEARTAVPALMELLKDKRVLWEAASALGEIGPEARAAVPALTGLLKDRDRNTWVAAIQALSEIGPEAKMAVPALTELLKDREAGGEAIETLTAIGPEAKAAVPALTELLKDKDVAREAARALAEIGPEARTAVPALIELLKDEGGRYGAALALGRIGPEAKAAAASLAKILGDKDAPDRQVAVWALGKIGPEAHISVSALAELLKDKDARWGAILALGRIGPAAGQAVPALTEMLKDKHFATDAVQVLGRIGPEAKAAVPAIVRYLEDKNDKNSFDRQSAAWTLGKIGPEAKHAIPVLARLFKDKNEYAEFRQSIARVLVKIGPPPISTFMELLEDQNEPTRSIAVWALGEIGPEASIAVPDLAKLLTERNASVRHAAVRALGRIGPKAKPAVPALIEMLKDRDVLLRWAAIKALGEIGLEAKASAPAIAELLKDSNREVRDAAAAVLGKSRPKDQPPPAEHDRIKRLIADLAQISQDWEFSTHFTGCEFAPLGSVEPFKSLMESEPGHRPNAAFVSLVELGPAALPFLLESLDDKTPSKLYYDNRSSNYPMCLRHALLGNPLNAREAKVLGDGDSLDEDTSFYERELSYYTVTVGDICLVAIGQITNRPYIAVEAGKGTYITSPVQDPELAAKLRAIWGASDHRQTLLDSLLEDLQTWSGFESGAATRLAYYFPDAADDVIIVRLDELEAAAAGTSQLYPDVIPEEMVTQAISWSKSPRLRAKLLEIFRKTKHGKVLLAAMPAVGRENDELVFPRLTEHLDAVPKNDPQWYEDGHDLLAAVGKRFPDRAEGVFRNFLKPGTVSRCRTVTHVLRHTCVDLAIPLLTPLLDDRRVAYENQVVAGLRGPILVCDEATETLAMHLKTLKFTREGSRESLDRQIETMRRRIAEMKTSK